MIERFFISLIRPSRVGLFLKDKIWMPIIHILIMIIIGASLLATRSFTMDYFAYSRSDIITSIQSTKNVIKVKYDGTKLIADNTSFNFDSYFISFNSEAKSPSLTKIGIYFSEEDIKFSYIFESKTIKYSDLNFDKSFDLENVRNKNIDDSLYFGIFIEKALSNFNRNYEKAIFISDLLYSIIFWGICFGLSVLSSYFSNPPIDMPIRIRLCLYDTLIYFIPVYFSFALGIGWVLYIGLGLSYIYTKFTFLHIRKVRIRK